MKQLVYFIAVGLVFTVLQVATVEADHEGGHMPPPMCDPNPACDPTSGNCCPTCDPNPACVMGDPNAKPCCGPTDGPPPQSPTGEAMCFDAATQSQVLCSAMPGAGDPNMTPPPSSHPHPPGEQHEHDCSEIPEAEGRALCETAKARGTPPTAAECAQMPTEEGRNQCMEHVGGNAPNAVQ